MRGQLEVITGGMFSGKSEELIRRIRRAIIARQPVQVFKHIDDSRYSIDHVTSHTGQMANAVAVRSSNEIRIMLKVDTTVIAIDEIQFMDEGVIGLIDELAGQGKRVIVAGLDMDFRGLPFGVMPILLSQAEEILKLHAICSICGEEASRSQRLINGIPAKFDDPIILVGAKENYEPRCRKHHEVPRS